MKEIGQPCKYTELLVWLLGGKFPSEKSYRWIMIMLLDGMQRKQERDNDPRSRSGKYRAKRELVFAVSKILREQRCSVEDAVAALPESVKETLRESGFKTGDVFSLRRAFIRADNEFYDGLVQEVNVDRRRHNRLISIVKSEVSGKEHWEEVDWGIVFSAIKEERALKTKYAPEK